MTSLFYVSTHRIALLILKQKADILKKSIKNIRKKSPHDLSFQIVLDVDH